MKQGETWAVFVDPGHGGLDPFGCYTTEPNKMFQHDETVVGDLHGHGVFYEGVSNRVLAGVLIDQLRSLGIFARSVANDYLDTPLERRVDAANILHSAYDKSCYVSIHSNAFDGTASGYEIYTTRGQTDSDILAELITQQMRSEFGNEIRYRHDFSDGDMDRESNFYVIHKTAMAAVLSEVLFFDNPDDVLKLINPGFIERAMWAHTLGIVEFFKSN